VALVVLLVPFRDLEELVVERAGRRVETGSAALRFGTLFMNRCDFADPRLPWSGVGQSGRGHSLSLLSFDARTCSPHFRP
jgi:acyl-CoA reductase-like NAD-dependent aldehyde dehydrogenase